MRGLVALRLSTLGALNTWRFGAVLVLIKYCVLCFFLSLIKIGESAHSMSRAKQRYSQYNVGRPAALFSIIRAPSAANHSQLGDLANFRVHLLQHYVLASDAGGGEHSVGTISASNHHQSGQDTESWGVPASCACIRRGGKGHSVGTISASNHQSAQNTQSRGVRKLHTAGGAVLVASFNFREELDPLWQNLMLHLKRAAKNIILQKVVTCCCTDTLE